MRISSRAMAYGADDRVKEPDGCSHEERKESEGIGSYLKQMEREHGRKIGKNEKKHELMEGEKSNDKR